MVSPQGHVRAPHDRPLLPTGGLRATGRVHHRTCATTRSQYSRSRSHESTCAILLHGSGCCFGISVRPTAAAVSMLCHDKSFQAHAAPLLSGAGCFFPTGMGLVDGASSCSGVSSKSAYGLLSGFSGGSAEWTRLAGGADVDRPWLSRLRRGGASARRVTSGSNPSTLAEGLTVAALKGEATLANSPAETNLCVSCRQHLVLTMLCAC